MWSRGLLLACILVLVSFLRVRAGGVRWSDDRGYMGVRVCVCDGLCT